MLVTPLLLGLTTTKEWLMADSSALDWLETCRTEYNAAGAEVRHAQQRLDLSYRALVNAAERYGAACVAAGEDRLCRAG